MANVVIENWEYTPEDGDEGIYTRYKLEGTIDDQPFTIKLGMEIDGGDISVDSWEGYDFEDNLMNGDQDGWDSLVVAMDENETLAAHMESLVLGDE